MIQWLSNMNIWLNSMTFDASNCLLGYAGCWVVGVVGLVALAGLVVVVVVAAFLLNTNEVKLRFYGEGPEMTEAAA